MRRSLLPGAALPSPAALSRSALRFSAFWNTSRKMPVLALSAGMTAVFFQFPLAYPSKSSPGCTERSMPLRSMPEGWPAASAPVEARPQAIEAARIRWMVAMEGSLQVARPR